MGRYQSIFFHLEFHKVGMENIWETKQLPIMHVGEMAGETGQARLRERHFTVWNFIMNLLEFDICECVLTVQSLHGKRRKGEMERGGEGRQGKLEGNSTA